MGRQRPLILTIVAAVLATAIGIVLSFVIHWFPVQASTQAHNTDRLYHVLVIACIPIFVLVVGVILYCCWQFRMKPGEELKDGPPIHGNTRLEVIWTAAPAILLLGMIAYSFVASRPRPRLLVGSSSPTPPRKSRRKAKSFRPVLARAARMERLRRSTSKPVTRSCSANGQVPR